MSQLTEMFGKLRESGRKALMPYFMGGYPDRAAFERLLLMAQDVGADAIEVGIPFSDPLADGPTIQEAGQKALAGGATPGSVLDTIANLRGELRIPVAVMTYVNPVLRIGPERFADQAGQAGVCGLIVPDLPPEESASIRDAAAECGIDLIQFVAPTTPDKRIARIAKSATGFIYLVSVTGVTGERPDEQFDLAGQIARVHSHTSLPLCVGFGISTPRQAADVSRIADGVIVGSALIKAMASQPGDPVGAAAELLSEMRKSMDAGGGAA